MSFIRLDIKLTQENLDSHLLKINFFFFWFDIFTSLKMQVISERAPISSSSSFSPKAIRLIGHDLL